MQLGEDESNEKMKVNMSGRRSTSRSRMNDSKSNIWNEKAIELSNDFEI